MLGNIFQGLPTFISEGLIPALNQAVELAIQGLNFAADNADAMVSTAVGMITSLGTALIEAAPKLLEAAAQCAMAFGQALISYDWLSLGSELMTAIQGMFPTESATTVMQPILDGITSALPGLLEKGVEIITNLANGIMSALPGMISTAGQIVTSLGTFLMDNAPTILNAGADLLLNLVNGIIDNLPEIAHSAIEVVMNMVQTLAENYPAIIQAGFDLIIKLVSGLSQAYPELVSAVLEICADLVTQFLSVDWVGLGADIVNGIIKGIVDLGDAFVNAILTMCSGALDAVKKFFGIESPSKVFANEVGRYIPEGIALGIEKNADIVTDAMKDLSAETLTAAGRLNVATAYEFNDNQNETAAILARMDAMLNLMSRYFPEMAETDVNMSSINRYLGAALS